MKYLDIEKIDKLRGRITDSETFLFSCHNKLECFNLCCRNLNLFLYPYDIIRLKQNLNLSSNKFIDRYIDIVMRSPSFFPEVLLTMADNKEKTCPFLSETGCSVYPDRPYSCRTFPVEQGVFYDANKKKTKLIHFFRPPDFCLGKHENKEWTPNSWIMNQEAVLYNKMIVKWSSIKSLFTSNPWGSEGADGPKAKMSFMAAYNIDSFREFVFSSTFLKRYRIKPDLKKKIKKNDVELLQLGFSWIKLYLWGIKSKNLRLKK